MLPEQMRRLGLTKSPDETGVLHDCYFRNADGPLYLTAAEYAEVCRREDRHKRGQEAVDLEALGATIRGARSKRRVNGRKIA